MEGLFRSLRALVIILVNIGKEGGVELFKSLRSRRLLEVSDRVVIYQERQPISTRDWDGSLNLINHLHPFSEHKMVPFKVARGRRRLRCCDSFWVSERIGQEDSCQCVECSLKRRRSWELRWDKSYQWNWPKRVATSCQFKSQIILFHHLSLLHLQRSRQLPVLWSVARGQTGKVIVMLLVN